MEHKQVLSQSGREERRTNRPCTMCDHCLSCQIALLPGQRLSVLQSTAMPSEFGEHCRAGKKEQIKTFPGGHLWWLSQVRMRLVQPDTSGLEDLNYLKKKKEWRPSENCKRLLWNPSMYCTALQLPRMACGQRWAVAVSADPGEVGQEAQSTGRQWGS